jgi:molybdate transport system substrate-binding protein
MRRAPRPRRLGLAAALAALSIVAGCASGDGGERREVLVSAAASLTDVFAAMEHAFEDAHPGTDVVLNFGASSMLREQILAGAPADVFASANETNMGIVVSAGAASGEPRIFATNTLTIAVPAGNPGDVRGLDAFGDASRLIGLCSTGVPCGDFGRDVLANAGVVPVVDTEEPNVRALLTKVEAGELDAGLVYLTDVVASGSTVEAITIRREDNVVARYPIAVLAEAPNPSGAEAFAAFVLSEDGRAILVDHGFGPP